jgi:hypothetical protein
MCKAFLFVSFLALVFVLPVLTFAQLPSRTPKLTGEQISAPENIKLLPGYLLTQMKGVDSKVGEIKSEKGLLIRYDVGALAGFRALSNEPRNVVWSKTQEFNDDKLVVTLLKDGTLIATFMNEAANFIAQTNSSSHVAEFLMMVMTYTPKKSPPK